MDELACRSDLAAGVEAVRAGKEEPPVFLLPQQPDARSDEVRCDTADLRRRVGLVERRGQCLAHELEHGRTGKLDSVAVARGERAEHERGVMRGELGAEALRFREVLPHAVELEGCRCPVRSNRDEHERVRSRARRRMTYRTRRVGEARQSCLRQLTRRYVRPLELRSERWRTGDGDRLQARLDGDADDHEVGARHDPRRIRDVCERASERRPLRGRGKRTSEDGEPVDREAHGLRISPEDHAGKYRGHGHVDVQFPGGIARAQRARAE